MSHTSLKLNTPCEILEINEVNPLISKCQIKVCYVGEQPNRNKTVITKEVAKKMAVSLRGCPIVGFYNEEKQDFEEHSTELSIDEQGNIKFNSITKPYGFVDINAKCWFQKYLDDGVNEREYLVTEGYIWTDQYPESKRIIEKGNNQSMELSKFTDGEWAEDDNNNVSFFIINDTLITKLCILGEDVEPCFEGANITTTFSFEPSFTEEVHTMFAQLQEYLKDEEERNKSKEIQKGDQMIMEEIKQDVEVTLELDNTVAEEEVVSTEEYKVDEKNSEENKDKVEKETSPKTEEDTEGSSEEKTEEKEKPTEDKDKEKKFSFEAEYKEAISKYNALEEKFNSIMEENKILKEFKASKEKQEKEEMIEKFYMLSDDDKQEVRDNIDTYSLDEIEGKLSVICFRKKVSFEVNDVEEAKTEDMTTYNLSDIEHDSAPEWIRSVRAVKNSQH